MLAYKEHMAKQNEKPVVIRHMALDHEFAVNARQKAAAELKKAREDGSEVREAYHDLELAEANYEIRRIKEINRYLGERDNAHTIVKLRSTPLAILIEKGSAKGEELMAAQDIETAFFAISGGLMYRSPQLEKIDKGHGQHWPASTEKAVKRYQAWANHWSKRRKTANDYTLECVIGAVIDQRPLRVIGEDLGYGRVRITRAVLSGLRDYAARAGWVEGKVAAIWIEAAEQTFEPGAR